MYIHIFLFRWKPDATTEHRASAARDVSAFMGAIPGLLEVAVGPNVSPNSGGYDFGGCMKFTDASAYADYCHHPLHRQLLDWLIPLIDAIELDLPAE
jgi:Stress responsive A/B Barrel Domain